MNRLLFVDDDRELLELNRNYFEALNYVVDVAANTDSAITDITHSSYSCIILDICMEGRNGLDLCRFVRERYDTPVIFLTNLTEEETLVQSFDCGGDDYLAKPYRLKELELRIRARIRDTAPLQAHTVTGSVLCLQVSDKQAFINNCSLGLTANEFDILHFLMMHSGIPFRQEEIYQSLWGESYYNTHSIQVLIMRIRKKLERLCPDKEFIKTQWGKGYMYTE